MPQNTLKVTIHQNSHLQSPSPTRDLLPAGNFNATIITLDNPIEVCVNLCYPEDRGLLAMGYE